jgi:hypothetical protein
MGAVMIATSFAHGMKRSGRSLEAVEKKLPHESNITNIFDIDKIICISIAYRHLSHIMNIFVFNLYLDGYRETKVSSV